MKQAPSISAKIVPQAAFLSGWRDKTRIFAIILEALHHSRRLQAERTLRQYRDLIDQGRPKIFRELNGRFGQQQDVPDD